MGKALVIKSADFANIAVSMSDIVIDKSFTNAELLVDAQTGFCDSTTGRIRTDVAGYKYKIVSVEGYTKLIVAGTYPIHIGAFYNSDEIGESSFVSCNGQLTKTGDGYISTTVTIPSGAYFVSININTSYTDHSLQVKKA